MADFRPSSFQILPTVIKNLLIINVLVFIAQNVLPNSGINLEDTFALHTWQSDLFRPWQLITHMFMHGNLMHIFSNMFALWMFGATLENLWGPKRFLTFYIISGLGAALCHLTVLYFENQQIINEFNALQYTSSDYMQRLQEFISSHNLRDGSILSPQFAQVVLTDNLNVATIGASGAVFGCLTAFGYLFPNTYIYISFLFPIKAKWFVIIYAGIELVSGLQNSAGDSVAHFAHLGGALAGFLLVYYWNKTNKRTFY